MSEGPQQPEHLPDSLEKRTATAAVKQPVKPDEDDANSRERSFLIFKAMPSWLASLLVNVSFVLLLALFAITTEKESIISLEAGEIDSASVEDINLDLEDMELSESDPLETNLTEPIQEVDPEIEELTIDTDILSEDSNILAADESNLDGAESSELAPTEMTNEIGGRTGNGKSWALKKNGGNAASEEAVQLALQWIADHQQEDGGWDLDHLKGGNVNGRPRTSPNPGVREDARLGATALALLPFLANGQTHKSGEFKRTIFRGLKFLMANAQSPRPNSDLPRDLTKPKHEKATGISFRDKGGHMYSHAMATIFLCECYTMSGDERLREFAQAAIDYIVSTQKRGNGGWVYQQPLSSNSVVDSSVLSWQIMALKSGKLAGLKVNDGAFPLASQFLDKVSIDDGAVYGYQEQPEKTSSGGYNAIHRQITAGGLLARMYMGWDRDEPALVAGTRWLSELGPDTADTTIDDKALLGSNREISVYYNYHATQVMMHYGGQDWKRWNEGYIGDDGAKVTGLRDFLIEQQEKEGPVKGSWILNEDNVWETTGGRLYVTALCCLTLEVYYRYLPMFSDRVTDDFSTDF